MINMNNLAEIIAEKEGLKESLSIAQIKEVLKITLQMLANMTLADVAMLLKRVRK